MGNTSRNQKWIESLGRHYPELGALYQASAQVKEGYSIGQHTVRVLNLYDQQKKFYPLKQITRRNQLECNIDDFLSCVLALHDIGKSQGPVNEQHKFTIPILTRYLNRWGYCESLIKLAQELVNHDELGQMLKRDQDPNVKILPLMIEKSNRSQLFFPDFSALQILFYVSDAGSYPYLRRALFTEDSRGRLYPQKRSFIEFEKWTFKSLVEPLQNDDHFPRHLH